MQGTTITDVQASEVALVDSEVKDFDAELPTAFRRNMLLPSSGYEARTRCRESHHSNSNCLV